MSLFCPSVVLFLMPLLPLLLDLQKLLPLFPPHVLLHKSTRQSETSAKRQFGASTAKQLIRTTARTEINVALLSRITTTVSPHLSFPKTATMMDHRWPYLIGRGRRRSSIGERDITLLPDQVSSLLFVHSNLPPKFHSL